MQSPTTSWITMLVPALVAVVLMLTTTAIAQEDQSPSGINFAKRALDASPIKPGLRPRTSNSGSRAVTTECYDDIIVYNLGLTNLKAWALSMLDSEGTQPPGTMDGNVHWIGSYDECVRQKATYTNMTTSLGTTVQHDFNAKYCRGNWNIGIYGAIAVCVPDTCTEEDVYQILSRNTSGPPVPGLWSVTCSGNDPVYADDAAAIGATFILSFFGALVFVATVVDYLKVSHDRATAEGSAESGHINQACTSHIDEDVPMAVVAAADKVDAPPDEGGSVTSQRQTEEGDDGDKSTRQCEVLRRNSGRRSTYKSKPDGDVDTLKGNTSESNGTFSNARSKTSDNFKPMENLKENTSAHEKKPVLLTWLSLLLCFSLRRNIPAVTSAKHPKGSFQCLNGIRFLSMCWIIIGHTCSLGTYVLPRPDYIVVENIFRQDDFLSHWTYNAIHRMSLAVESFFVLSASLTAISFIKQCDRNGGRMTWRQIALYYFHRYWRLTPVYAMIMMTYTSFFTLWGSGPLFPPGFIDAANCRTSWWTHIIYLNNFLALDKMCMGWSWYLANDFQFYVIAPPFVFLLYKFPIAGGIFLLLGFGGHLASSIVILRPNPDFGTFYIEYYIKPWCRFGPYAIGMALGYIMYRTKCKQKMHWALVLFGWTVAAFLIVSAVYGDYGRGTEPCENCNPWSDHLRTAFQATLRDFFSLGIAWMIFACCSGYGGIVDTILSWKLWIPLGRLTFTGYLLHPIIIYYNMYTRRRLFYIQYSTMIIFFCGYLLMTLGLAFIFTLVFELPMLQLEKIVFPRKK